MIFRLLSLFCCCLLPLQAGVVISEFMASNQATLADEDGDFSDWIEISNTGTVAVDLNSWYLTDDSNFDPTDPESGWSLPPRVIGAGQSIVIFASGKDRGPVGGEWHTNFQLSSGGEYLALFQADGTTAASEFAPSYPEQEVDISYGRGAVALATLEFIGQGAAGKSFIPSNGAEGLSWTGGGEPFDDSGWTQVKTGVGFDSGSGPSGFTLVENFDGLNVGALEGQGGWSTSATGVRVAIDPADAENQVMNQTGNGLRAWKAMTISEGSTGTVFYRMRRDGGVNISIGTSDKTVPGTSFAEFEAQLNNQGDDVLKVRNGGAFTDVDQFADGVWYEVWMVVDNASDTYKVYLKGGTLTERTLLDAGALTAFGFRNGSATNAMETFFARTGNGQSGTWLIDDIYLADGENLGNPAEGLSLGDFIDEEGNLESEMAGVSASAYLRVPFDLEELDEVSSLTLRMRYDDGFVAYLNGVQIAMRNAPANVDWQSVASSEREATEVLVFEEIDVTEFTKLLVPNSTNVLAIHGLNVNSSDGDFLISPELVGVASSASVEMLYFSSPTPGQSNGSGFLGFVNDTQFSKDRGFYQTPIDVVISSQTEGATIIYTTDGSVPGVNHGTELASPATISISTTTPLRAVAVKDGFRASNIDTHTYIFPADVIMQGNFPAGYPATWKGDNGNGSETADYAMDPEVTQSAIYASVMDDALMAIPTISLVTDKDHLFSPATGIYQNPQQKGSAWERPVSFEVIHPNGDRQGIQVDAGFRIQGGHTRLPSKSPKHSFRVSFKRDFGPAKLDYDLFPDDPDAAREFDQLILRGSGNQSWLHHNTFKGDNRGRAQYIRDQWAKDVQLAMGHPATRSMYAHLYINGIYWGMYNPSERGSAGFGESYLGGEKDDYNTLNSGEGVDGANARADYQALISLANQGLTDPARYAQIGELLDLEAFTDYMIIQQYGGNLDWDHHNWYALRNTNGGRWYFLCWDSEFVFISPTDNVLSLDNADDPSRIWRRLLANDEYRVLFADRVQKHLANDGLLTPDAVTSMWDARKDQMFEAIVAESARWGDYRRDVDPVGGPTPIPLYDRDGDWMVERNRLFNSYFPVRTANVIGQYRAAGYLPALEAPVFDVYSGRVVAGHPLQMTSPGGEAIYYTTNGSDPRVAAQVSQVDLILEGDGMKVFVPTDDSLGESWQGGQSAFDDSGWISGAAAGFEAGSGDYGELYDIDLQDVMWRVNASCFLRMRFTIPDQATLDAISEMSLGVRYDDGFVAFINGAQVASGNAPAELTWNASGSSHPDDEAAVYQPFTLGSSAVSSLKVGENILAIHALNSSAGSSDFLIDAILSATLESPAGFSQDAQLYDGSVPINGPSKILARVFDGSNWSALTEATYFTGAPASMANLVISEIMYNPDGPEDAEFVELLNIGNETLDLSGVRFSEGLDFEFSLGMMLSAGERILIVRDEAAFKARYGAGLPIAGGFANETTLDNGGERLTLSGQDGEVIQTLRYNDKASWPTSADGDGYSLVLVSPESNPDPGMPESWRAGSTVGGTPGSSEGVIFVGVAGADDDGDGISALLEFAFGTSDAISGDAIGAFRMEGVPGIKLRRRSAMDGVSLAIEMSDDLETWVSAQGTIQLTDEIEIAPGIVERTYQFPEGQSHVFIRVKAVQE